mmetsp:Transcript_50623/g.151357  ORF Transcript_50623/g.151357 Transcript_50623/m.151357 type:complete len:212 (-) Transcript_50623:12-647(-)
MLTVPPAKLPVPLTVTGGQPVGASASMPRRCSATTSGAIGRLRMCSSPSTITVPGARAVAAVRKRVAVPALPRKSGAAGVDRVPVPVTRKLVASGSSTVTPMARKASAIRAVSSLFSAPVRCERPLDKAASSSTRLVTDFEPGGATLPRSGHPGGTTARAGADMYSLRPFSDISQRARALKFPAACARHRPRELRRGALLLRPSEPGELRA